MAKKRNFWIEANLQKSGDKNTNLNFLFKTPILPSSQFFLSL